MSPVARTFIVVAFVLTLAPSAHAQLVGLKHIWTVPGVMNTANGLSTFIACTNTGDSQTIGVEVYGAGGAFVADDSLAVAPGATVVFGLSGASGISVDVSLATGTLSKGNARVMANGKGALCSAFLADSVSPIPTGIASLTVAKKFSQKGD